MKPFAWRRQQPVTPRPNTSRRAQGRGPVGFEQEARAAWDRVVAALANSAEKAIEALVGLTRLEENSSLDEAQRLGLLPDTVTSRLENRRLLSVLLECVQKPPSEDPLLVRVRQSDWLDARIREISLVALFTNNEASALSSPER